MELEKKEISIPNGLIGDVFGKLDENVRKIEQSFQVSVVNRGEAVVITGRDAGKAAAALQKLTDIAQKKETINSQNVNYIISLLQEDENGGDDLTHVDKLNDDHICFTVSGKAVRPKTLGQKKYVDQIRRDTIVFGVGPAGTGKTYLAMAMAITAFKTGEVGRIILTRPAIEAGEKLGFLPGDLQQKVDPFLRPLYDALYEIMGAETFMKNMEKGAIEVAPLAYMRGRTLDNAFIVLDEAQNTTPEQMKMFLTRIGFGSKAVVTGDVTQIDLPDGKKSGLIEATRILEDIDGVGVSLLSNRDVVRHPLVQRIIAAYEKSEKAGNRGRYERRTGVRGAPRRV